MLLRLGLLCLALVTEIQALGLLAIDYGADSFKASYVGPGVPFDVLYNKDSKRKTPSIVTLHGQDSVLVGADASALSTRFPRESFSGVKMLLGRDIDDPLVSAHAQAFPSSLHSSSSPSRPVLAKPDGTTFSPEEILALQLKTAKDAATLATGGDMSFDTVITVPASFEQSHRQAILDAANLAGLKVLSLVHDGSAVAVNYAMTRTFPTGTPEHHLFYDAGASAIRATIVSFETINVKDGLKPHDATQLTVQGLGWSEAVGGLTLDLRLRNLLEKQFTQGDVQANDRALTKLLKEANRVKHILSANTEAMSRIENILPDVDFKGKVTRDEFQTACSDLTDAFSSPITQALESANLTMADLKSVILVGGASRVPMIQSAVKSIVPEDKLAQNVNADEAAVLGAVLYGAGLSSQFKAKDIRVRDVTPRAVQAVYLADDKASEEETSALTTTTVFDRNSQLGGQNILPFKKYNDFELEFGYELQDGSVSSLFSAQVTGFDKALTNLSEAEIHNATVRVTVEQDLSGLITVPKVALTLPERSDQTGVAGRILNMFGGNKEEGEAKEKSTDGPEDDKKASVKAAESRPLKITFKQSGGIPTLSVAERDSAKRRLLDIEHAEARKKVREEARNLLEAYTYKARDMLEGTELQKFSAAPELQKIKDKIDHTSEWIWDEGETAPTKDLRTKRTDLEKMVQAITSRKSESESRPSLVSAMRIVLDQASNFFKASMEELEADLKTGDVARYTKDELDGFQNSVKSTSQWLEDGLKKQASLAENVDPVLKRLDLEAKAKTLTAEIEKLSKKRRPRVSTSNTSAPESTTQTTSSSSTSSSDSSETQHPRDEL